MTLQASKLTFRRNGRTLLQSVDVVLEPGSLTVVLGPNGAGKTTLLNLLAGLERPHAGDVWLGSQPLASMDSLERACRLAVMTQDQPLDFAFGVEEVVTLGAYPLGLGRVQERLHCQAWLQRLELQALAQRDYLSLSGGERQRVQLARVLAQCGEQTMVLLLDEPVSAMDLKHQHLCLQQLRALADAGAAVLVILHDLALTARYADAVLLLKQAEVLAQGDMLDIMTPSNLSALFDVRVEVSRVDGMPRFSSSLADDAVPP
ncbi:heme ABC transporter ATP-binding protein [Marinobacterium rhizophilum]|uniref:Heme ABC transporter ATP-binding protein n=1 Tax=Marinobacterium rhizophilum TaxID=420402 RepID=A0ABY5HIV2_9GAMM|nr:heme ABC transporter ATP-binding protein [Marinobacterium rhizophilum]UTW10911.1 heme ABC transporter ATP-binding protein [Marinobacterium rhizophilum]